MKYLIILVVLIIIFLVITYNNEENFRRGRGGGGGRSGGRRSGGSRSGGSRSGGSRSGGRRSGGRRGGGIRGRNVRVGGRRDGYYRRYNRNNWGWNGDSGWNVWRYLYPYYDWGYLPENPGCDGKACGGYCTPFNSKCCGGSNPSTCGMNYCSNNTLCN